MLATQSNRQRLRTPKAAAYCGSAESTFEKLRVTGGGPAFLKLGRTVVYDTADLDAWLESKRCLSTSDITTHPTTPIDNSDKIAEVPS